MLQVMEMLQVNAGAAGRGTPPANGGGGGMKRDPLLERYEEELSRARRWARTIALLYAFSRFLAYCNLTWASVVLLGSFASSLIRLDFTFVAMLLLLEAGRLATAAASSRLLTRALVRLSQDPRLIDHARDAQYLRARTVRLASPLLQLLFILPSLLLPLLALFHYRSLRLYPDSHDTHNLQLSLLIFYSLVIINSIVGLTHLLCAAVTSLKLRSSSSSSSSEQSVWRYFDKVLANAMSGTVVQADEFEFLRFAYSMLAGDFARNVQAEAVAKNHKELVRYLYANRVGVDYLVICLDAGDAFLRLAAANMVGFWADEVWGVGVEGAELALPEELLTKLADRVGTGQVGWAAVNSIGALAKRPEGARLIQATHTTLGKPLVDRLVDLIDPSSSRSLSLVRSLVKFYERLSVDEQQPPVPFADPQNRLVPKLRAMAAGAKRHRLRVQAAYLLLIMGFGCDPTVVSAIDPTKDDYWFSSEVSMLVLLQNGIDKTGVSTLCTPTHHNIRKDANICPPSWALDPHIE
ncbi:hypothetical protein L7F22_008820 [Adiantum nelumboides]|nr:hypothetical protein [Adiantum nelumboides]